MFSTTLPFFVAAIGPDPTSARPTARYLPCFSSTTTKNCLSVNSPLTFRIPGAMMSAPPTTCGTAPMSTTTRDMPSRAEVLVNTGANSPFLRNPMATPSTNMTSESLTVSISTLALWVRYCWLGRRRSSSIRGLESRSLSIVLTVKNFSESSRETIFKRVPSPDNHKSPGERRMSEVAAKIFEESLNKVVLVQLKGGRSVRGKLYSFHQHMNLVLADTEDVTNAELTKKLGTIIVRGDNVVLVSPPPKR